MKVKIRKLLKNNKILSYILIFFMALFVCIPLFSKYMNISADDGIQHICRIIGTDASLKEFKLFPVIMSGFCNGFGYSWNIFYSPLTAYLPLIFKIFTNSYVLSLKLFMFSCMLFSGIFMYKLVYRICKTHKAGVISAIIYMAAPYHLTDLYTRIAIAELASFVFLPILFIGMYDLINKDKKKTYCISIGAVGLILTHNVIAVYAAIFCAVYLLFYYKKLNNKVVIKNILINIGIILLCTSFYWIPLLEHYFTTTYEVFVPERMYKDNTLIGSKLSFLDLFITKPYGMNFHIGLPIIFGIVLAFIYRKRIKGRHAKLLNIFLGFGIVSIIIASKIFPFEYLPDTLKMIQFTWRMMEFAMFFLSIVSGITITMFIHKNKKKDTIVSTVLIAYIALLVISQNTTIAIPFDEEKYLEPIPVTSQTGRVHAGCATFEYLPQKAFANREYIETRTQDVIVIEGEANITNQNKESTNLSFEFENAKGTLKFELPYIFYVGYNAKLTDEHNNIKDIKITESEKGFCMIEISNVEKGKIKIEYTGSMLMKISYVLTLIGIASLIIYYYKLKKTKVKKVI